MLGDNPDEWSDAILRRLEGDEMLSLLIVAGRLPKQLRLPIDDDWFEEFQIDAWVDGAPVYRSIGFVLRCDE